MKSLEKKDTKKRNIFKVINQLVRHSHHHRHHHLHPDNISR